MHLKLASEAQQSTYTPMLKEFMEEMNTFMNYGASHSLCEGLELCIIDVDWLMFERL